MILTSNTTHVKLGESLALTANVIGGRPQYTYQILVKNTTTHGQFIYTGQNGTSATGNITVIETPPKLGASFYRIDVTDTLGMVTNATIHTETSR